ncbi:MAG TPA: hypothetical protein VHU81_01805 [Thermoanaerobaculia bacterium]|nr:hypothetical protein [Thermoanaerobaculia bacterium]
MKRQTWLRMVVVLAVLAATLGFGMAPVQQAGAAACCETCDAGELSCITNPSSTACNGNADCCYNIYKSCYRYCIVCGGPY